MKLAKVLFATEISLQCVRVCGGEGLYTYINKIRQNIQVALDPLQLPIFLIKSICVCACEYAYFFRRKQISQIYTSTSVSVHFIYIFMMYLNSSYLLKVSKPFTSSSGNMSLLVLVGKPLPFSIA